jgi:hypothetical protein
LSDGALFLKPGRDGAGTSFQLAEAERANLAIHVAIDEESIGGLVGLRRSSPRDQFDKRRERLDRVGRHQGPLKTPEQETQPSAPLR